MTLTDLKVGGKYTATIIAHNEIGASAESTPSPEVQIKTK